MKPPDKTIGEQPSAFEFFVRFPDEETARNYLIKARWPDGVTCTRCGHDEVYLIRGGQRFECKDCKKQFSVRVGTVMEDSPIPLRKWLFAMYLFGIHSKGVASTMMAKQLGITQKSAWFMNHRIRKAFENDGVILDGIVEDDEAYIGGKEKNKQENKKLRAGRGAVGKQVALSIRQRNSQSVASPVSDMRQEILSGNVNCAVASDNTVCTDDHKGYDSTDPSDKHEVVRHSTGEYISGDADTHGVEGMRSILERTYHGIYHHWSHKHGHRYISELARRPGMKTLPAFDESDGDGVTMIRLLMSGMVGKRLTYRDLVDG